jgi:hypothetical protein
MYKYGIPYMVQTWHDELGFIVKVASAQAKCKLTAAPKLFYMGLYF